ncbi:MAG TPA: histidine kinase [Verrucomicrobiae bacterium]|nr:histidine kinase [Verrucomicrobiae bacterium]
MTLTNATDVLALSAKDALSHIPVSVTGVVTAYETNWNGKFFVQDSSGGVFVGNISGRHPVPGDVVQVSGVSFPGGYAPTIAGATWRKIGTAPLPPAKPVTIEQLMSGTEDSQRIEISGIVRSAWMSEGVLGIELVSGGYRLRAYVPISPNVDPQSFVGAKVTLNGTAATSFNAPLRHFLTVTLYVPQLSDFIIQEAAPMNLFNEPLTPLNGIAQYREGLSPGYQVHVRGIVTYQRKGKDLFLEDGISGLQVKSKLDLSVSPGDVVEAVGFPAVENQLPVLEDAVFRKTGEAPVKLQPLSVTIADLEKGLHHADFITLQGRLLDRMEKENGIQINATNIQTTLALQTTNFFFTAEKETVGENDYLAAIPIGSLVEVSGICMLGYGDNRRIDSVNLLLPASINVHVLQRPGWWTPQRLLAGLVILLAVLLVAVCWILMIVKRNSILKSLVKEREAAQAELQVAHDKLEERVEERTAQLKVEMTARKESEVQFRAVLTERTRLAQELHDTLEQTMTGIALQLDLVANKFEQNPDTASQHLKVARSLTRQSQSEIRHSVWGLRSRTTEQFNLPHAISISSQQIVNGAGMQVEIETSGEVQPLSEVAEENLLRISQEAITNVVKHSGASHAKIELQFSPQKVALRVTDNGKGFVPETAAGPKDGHFGLLGISERAERLGGRAQIISSADGGTSIYVEIPIVSFNGA